MKDAFSLFFSKQARKPDGLFGRLIMKLVFDYGNAFLNDLVEELLFIQKDDRIFEIGFGTGKLIYMMAQRIDEGVIEGVDFSEAMVSIARKRNKKNIAKGKVTILEGDFDTIPYKKEKFSKACSVNTIYFWSSPLHTATRIAEILKPDGKFVLGFEDIEQMKQRKLKGEIFHLYSKDDVTDLLINAGFSKINIVSRKLGKSIFHGVVAEKNENG